VIVRKEHSELWYDAIQDDAERVWNNIHADVAPPLRRTFARKYRLPPQRWLLAAAIAIAMVIGIQNLTLMRQIADVRDDYLIATLTADSSTVRLATLHNLSGKPLSTDAVEVLRDLVRRSKDPNVQLAALDLLLDSNALSGDEEIKALLEQVRHNSQFIKTAVRARSVRT
jgi:hypothetical protein